MKTKLTTVATFSDREKAERVRDRLNEAGIAAELRDESKLQKYWFASKPLAHMKVQVDLMEVPKASRVLKSADLLEHILCGEIRCPECGSACVEYPQFTRKFITTTVVEFLCWIHVLDKTFYCTQCHYTWPVRYDLAAKTDALNWPHKDRGLVPQPKG